MDQLPKPSGHNMQPVVVRQTKSRPAVVVLSVLLILALIGAGLAVYFYVNANGKNMQLTTDKQALSKEVASLKAISIGSAQADAQYAKMPNFNTFITQYNNFLENRIEYSSETGYAKEVGDIEAAIKAYYKISTMPDGWAVLNIYQVVKPETAPTGDIYALVYWPKSDSKPASFMSIYKLKGGSWKYDEHL